MELFKLALPCLSAVGGALPPDYMESNYVAMMEKQSSMDAEGNFNPQPADTSRSVIITHHQPMVSLNLLTSTVVFASVSVVTKILCVLLQRCCSGEARSFHQ